MSADTNTGGPAFPHIAQSYSDVRKDGMTLRDYFAAKAMQGICASGPTSDWSNTRIAVEAYEMADAMLKARQA
jgi:hypothetical protein